VMMGTASFGIVLRTMAFQRIQSTFGLMRTATIGGAFSTLGYLGYSSLSGSPLSFAAFCGFAAAGTLGSTLSAASTTPFFSQLAAKAQMGTVMSISSMSSSAARVIGPPLFGALFTTNIRTPYRLSCVFTASAAAFYFLVGLVHDRQPEPLASKDSMAASRAGVLPDDAIAELQALLRATIIERGYNLEEPANVAHVKQLLLNALPLHLDDDHDERLDDGHLHDHHLILNREHSKSVA